MRSTVKGFLLFLIVVSPFIFIIAGCISSINKGQNMLITKEVAIEIADKKAKELNYNIQVMNLTIDEQNTEWNNYLTASGIENLQPELVVPLKNRHFWAVYYKPRLIQLGGDLWVFVDKKLGEVITVIQGD